VSNSITNFTINEPGVTVTQSEQNTKYEYVKAPAAIIREEINMSCSFESIYLCLQNADISKFITLLMYTLA
jgi:hypothetical protein